MVCIFLMGEIWVYMQAWEKELIDKDWRDRHWQTLTRRWRQIQGSSDGTGVGDAERNEEKKRDGEREVDKHRDRETNSET